jgi:hypothetical protein
MLEPRCISSEAFAPGKGSTWAGDLYLLYVLAAYCLIFDNARVESRTINTGRRRFPFQSNP